MLQGRINMIFHHGRSSFHHTEALYWQAILQPKVEVSRIAGVCMQAEKDHSGREFSPFTPRRSLPPLQSPSSYRPRHPRCRCQHPCSRPCPLARRRPRHRQPGDNNGTSLNTETRFSIFTSAFSSSAFLIRAASSSSSVAVTTFRENVRYLLKVAFRRTTSNYHWHQQHEKPVLPWEPSA